MEITSSISARVDSTSLSAKENYRPLASIKEFQGNGWLNAARVGAISASVIAHFEAK